MPHGLLYAIILAFTLNAYPVSANPVQSYNLELVEARENTDSNGAGFISPKAWIPIVVVILLLCIVALMTWSKESMLKAVTIFGTHGNSNVGAPSGTGAARQLTTEELVGPITDTDLPTSGEARPGRRTRRPRRTPSQMSVTSLPAYNKEPGESELVIFRGRDADEDDMPLLHNDGPSGDISSQNLRSTDVRPSFDTQETSSLLRVGNDLPRESFEPNDQAPPYFEAMDHTSEHDSGVPTTSTSSSPEPVRQRKGSGFLSFLNRMSPMTSYTPVHRRMESNQSSDSRERLNPSRTSTRRPSSSISSFRPISDQNSSTSNRLNSPSLISLTPISLPLSHTLVRTEFTYPKSGPTPEQLKVISSRENFSRFGVPYGPDAIAFAASSSHQDLGPPPPDFGASSSRLPSDPPRPGSSGAADSQEGRPSTSEPTAGEGAEHATPSPQPLPVDTQSENVTNTSRDVVTPAESSSSSSHSKDPNPISPADSSTSNPTVPLVLSAVSEFGSLTPPTSSTPQNATGFAAHSESRASKISFLSYVTADESLPRERMGGYVSVDSRSSSPRLGDQHVSDTTGEVLITTVG